LSSVDLTRRSSPLCVRYFFILFFLAASPHRRRSHSCAFEPELFFFVCPLFFSSFAPFLLSSLPTPSLPTPSFLTRVVCCIAGSHNLTDIHRHCHRIYYARALVCQLSPCLCSTLACHARRGRRGRHRRARLGFPRVFRAAPGRETKVGSQSTSNHIRRPLGKYVWAANCPLLGAAQARFNLLSPPPSFCLSPHTPT
jgi:hypothetical protein